MTQNASRLYDELIKFGSQYFPRSDVRHLGGNGVDDGGINDHRKCEFDEID